MTMRFQPANIRLINRRVCSSAVIGPAVQDRSAANLRGGKEYHHGGVSQTAARAKGNETYGFFPLWNPHSSLQAALSSPAGTLDGPRQKQRPAFLPLVGTPAQNKTPSNPEGLDRVAPYQKSACCGRRNEAQVGPNQSIKRGQFKLTNSVSRAGSARTESKTV